VRAFGEAARATFGGFVPGVAQAERGLGGFGGALATVGSRALALAGVMGGIGGATITAAIGADALARSMSRAAEQAAYLRARYGEATDNFIRMQQRVGENIGQTVEQTQRQMDQFAERFHETVYGSMSELYRTLSQYGDAGENVFRQLDRARQAGMGAQEAFQKIAVPWFDRQKTVDNAREVARALRIPYEELVRMSEELKKTPMPWQPSPQQQRQYAETQERTRDHLNRISNIFKDWWAQEM
jgi:hypothetical protein